MPQTTSSIIDKERARLKEYFKTTPRRLIKKKELVDKFPALNTELSKLKLEDIINKYSN
jgi:hypothetical protein